MGRHGTLKNVVITKKMQMGRKQNTLESQGGVWGGGSVFRAKYLKGMTIYCFFLSCGLDGFFKISVFVFSFNLFFLLLFSPARSTIQSIVAVLHCIFTCLCQFYIFFFYLILHLPTNFLWSTPHIHPHSSSLFFRPQQLKIVNNSFLSTYYPPQT